MSYSILTTPKHWYGRSTRRDVLGGIAASIGAAGTIRGFNPLTQSIVQASGTSSLGAIANAAQSGYAWVANHGLDGDAYQQEFESLSSQGYRLIKISGYSVNGQDFYASIWDMSPGPAWVGMHRVAGADYQVQFDTLTAQGYRPVDISGYEKDGGDHYAAIFEQSEVNGWSASHGVAGADYQAVFDTNVASGLRPLRVSGFTAGGNDYIASIWVGDDGNGWAAVHGVDNAGYQAAFDQWTGAGMRLVDISGYEFDGTDHYTAIFDNSPKAYWIAHHNLDATAYQAAFDENGAAGYALVHIAGYGVSGEDRYAAIWASDSKPTGGTVDEYSSLPAMPNLDTLAQNAITAANVPSVSVAISKDGNLVYANAFGFTDFVNMQAVTSHSLYRIASVTKPITSTAIMTLSEAGDLDLDDLVFAPGGLLEGYGTAPHAADVDAITIRHLLTHTAGGWSNSPPDVMFEQIGLGADDLITWVLDSVPLDNAPGTNFAYSNFGYCVLGRVIEAVTGQSYESYVQNQILGLCGITDMEIAGDTEADAKPGEVVYDTTNTDSGLGDPYTVPVSRMDSHGGWIATAVDLIRFVNRVDKFATVPDILDSASLDLVTTATSLNAGYGMGWAINRSGNYWHDGRLAGTESFMVRSSDGVCWAAIANGNGINLEDLGWDMVGAITTWPTGIPLT